MSVPQNTRKVDQLDWYGSCKLSGQSQVEFSDCMRGRLMKVLLAVDGSACSDAAIEEVCRRAWPEGSLVKVINAFELSLPPTAETWALPSGYFEEMDQAIRKHSQTIVEQAIGKLKAKLNKAVRIDGGCFPG